MPTLFDPLQIGDLAVPNRIFMAPLTRNRSTGPGRVPNALMRDYYVQRASAGLIIHRGDLGRADGRRLSAYARASGPTSRSRAGARSPTACMAPAGASFCSSGMSGASPIPVYLDGALPVAPSAIAPKGHVSLLRPQRPYVAPRALETEEIPGVVEAYRQGAENAKAAGFDGVEIHGANGYLLDQFLQDGTNKRTDRYGGSIENRARLMLEVTDAVISVWGPGRVGMHLAPRGDAHDMGDSDLPATFGYVARELGKRKIAFLCARESTKAPRLGPDAQGGVRRRLSSPTKASRARPAEAVARRRRSRRRRLRQALHRQSRPAAPLRAGAPLNPWNPTTFYGDGPARLHRLSGARRQGGGGRVRGERAGPHGFRCSISMKAKSYALALITLCSTPSRRA